MVATITCAFSFIQSGIISVDWWWAIDAVATCCCKRSWLVRLGLSCDELVKVDAILLFEIHKDLAESKLLLIISNASLFFRSDEDDLIMFKLFSDNPSFSFVVVAGDSPIVQTLLVALSFWIESLELALKYCLAKYK